MGHIKKFIRWFWALSLWKTIGITIIFTFFAMLMPEGFLLILLSNISFLLIIYSFIKILISVFRNFKILYKKYIKENIFKTQDQNKTDSRMDITNAGKEETLDSKNIDDIPLRTEFNDKENGSESSTQYKSQKKKMELNFDQQKSPLLNKYHFELLLICTYWIMEKENEEINSYIEQTFNQIFEFFSYNQNLLHIPDKKNILNSAIGFVNKNIESDSFNDSVVIEKIQENLINSTNAEIELFLYNICLFIHKDKKISAQEIEALKIIQHHFNIPDNVIDKALNKSVQGNKKEKRSKKYQKKLKTRYKLIPIFATSLSIILIVFMLYSTFVYFKTKNNLSTFNMAEILTQHPKLVFKRASFHKYVIFGTPNDSHEYFKKLSIYQIKGSADFQFDMKGLKIDSDSTDYISRKLFLNYYNDTTEDFPLEIDVNIDPKNIYVVPEEEAPKAVSKQTANKIGKIAAVPASIVGGVVGAKAGSTIGGSIFPLAGRVIGGFLGAGSMAGAAGYSTYVMTSKFFKGMKAKSLTIGQKDDIIENSKSLIALELMGSDPFENENWDSDVKEYYIKEFEKTLTRVFSSYGWKSVVLKNI